MRLFYLYVERIVGCTVKYEVIFHAYEGFMSDVSISSLASVYIQLTSFANLINYE